MRICFVSKEIGGVRGGGIGTYVVEAGHALTAGGHEVWLLTEDSGLDASQRAAVASLNGFHRVVSIEPSAEPRWFHANARHGYAARVHEALKAIGVSFDYVEFADYHAEGSVALREQRLFGSHGDTVMAVNLHTPSYECYSWNGQLHRATEEEWETFGLEEQAIKDAPWLHSPSAAMRDVVCGRLLLDAREVAVVPYPMRPLVATPLKVRQRVEDLRFLFFGRIEPRKGLMALLEAFARMPDVRIELVGADTPFAPLGGSYREWLETGAPANVKFVGSLCRDALLGAIARADVCFLPSVYENWPNACIEAMQLGRVVVGSHHGGMAEMIEDGVSGLLVDGRDPAAIVDSVDRLRAMLHALPAMGAAAAARSRKLADPALYAATIERLVAERRRAPRACAVARSPARVSVIVPFHRDADTVDEAIDSAIGQSHPELEVLLIDDGSPLPDAAQILRRQRGKDPRVRVVSKANGGLSSARNCGIAHATGELLLFLDADNVLCPDYASVAADVLARFPEYGFVVPYVRFMRANGEEHGIYNPLPFRREMSLRMNRFGDAGACFRAAVFERSGVRYDERLKSFEDWALWLELDRLGVKGACIPRVLYDYRERDGSMVQRDGWHRLNASIGLMIADHLGSVDPATRDLLLCLQQTWGLVAHEREAAVQDGRAADGGLRELHERLDQSYRDHAGTMAHRDHLLRVCTELSAQLECMKAARLHAIGEDPLS